MFKLVKLLSPAGHVVVAAENCVEALLDKGHSHLPEEPETEPEAETEGEKDSEPETEPEAETEGEKDSQ